MFIFVSFCELLTTYITNYNYKNKVCIYLGYLSILQSENIQYIRKYTVPVTHQIRSNTGANTEPDVNVDGVTAVLSDLSETRQRSRNGKSKHQDGFQQLGAIRDG